jgi:hypothetical protein
MTTGDTQSEFTKEIYGKKISKKVYDASYHAPEFGVNLKAYALVRSTAVMLGPYCPPRFRYLIVSEFIFSVNFFYPGPLSRGVLYKLVSLQMPRGYQASQLVFSLALWLSFSSLKVGIHGLV